MTEQTPTRYFLDYNPGIFDPYLNDDTYDHPDKIADAILQNKKGVQMMPGAKGSHRAVIKSALKTSIIDQYEIGNVMVDHLDFGVDVHGQPVTGKTAAVISHIKAINPHHALLLDTNDNNTLARAINDVREETLRDRAKALTFTGAAAKTGAKEMLTESFVDFHKPPTHYLQQQKPYAERLALYYRDVAGILNKPEETMDFLGRNFNLLAQPPQDEPHPAPQSAADIAKAVAALPETDDEHEKVHRANLIINYERGRPFTHSTENEQPFNRAGTADNTPAKTENAHPALSGDTGTVPMTLVQAQQLDTSITGLGGLDNVFNVLTAVKENGFETATQLFAFQEQQRQDEARKQKVLDMISNMTPEEMDVMRKLLLTDKPKSP